MFSLYVLLGCVTTNLLPDLGVCAEYPDGVYEYGQVDIGTCLAAPTSLTWVGDNGTHLAVTNTNVWHDFRSGSLLTFDFENLDLSEGRNLVSDLDPHALEVPDFSGAASYAAEYETLLVASRGSEGSRTREAVDPLYFIDLSNVNAPAFSTEIGPDESGGSIDLGYDMDEVVYDPTSDRAWSIQRTAHSVSTVDLASRPARVVPAGGDGRLTGSDFVDVDGSGSRADFSVLELDVGTEVRPNTWTVSWAAATVRSWVATAEGAYRTTGNGESTWVRSGIPSELDLADAEGVVVEVRDPSFVVGSGGYGRLVFVDQGDIRAADEVGDGETWAFESDALLLGSDGDDALSDPFMVLGTDGWYLYYTSTVDGISELHFATSLDGFEFSRQGAVVAVSGESVSDASVLYDPQVDRWRMWYSRVDVNGSLWLGQAYSDDLGSWTIETIEEEGYVSPTVAYWSGAFHLLHAGQGFAGSTVQEATSIDGYSWVDVGERFTPESGALTGDGVALQVVDESAFRLENLDGEIFTVAVPAGLKVASPNEGWLLEMVAGHLAGPSDAETYGAFGVSVSSRIGDVVWLDLVGDDGVARIGRGTVSDSGMVVDAEPALSPPAKGFASEGVSSAVVVEQGAGYVMYFAGTEAQVTSIGRASSSDGLVWTMDEDPLYEGVNSWESVEVSPGSVQVLSDGTIRLWYTGTDGDDAKIGLLESTDDGAKFAPVAGDPYLWMFDSETPGSWDDSGVRDPFVVRDGDVDHMWFSGFDGDYWQIGYASRASDTEAWETSVDAEGDPRAVLSLPSGSLGSAGVMRPVVTWGESGIDLLYAAIDTDAYRVGLASGLEPDRFHRDLHLPTLADTWSFTVVPPNDEDAISLDFTVEGLAYSGRGCTALELDAYTGMLYVGCKLVPYVFVLDVRDDSTTTFDDLNYLGVESVLALVTSTGSDSGMRDLITDPARGLLWGIADEPEGIYAIRISDIVDDASTEVLRDRILGILPLPPGLERDEGVDTQANVGPGQLVMHPDGQHLFATNFNDNSVSVYNLAIGPMGTLVGTVDAIGENPYAITISPDGRYAVVANFSGEVTTSVSSTLVVIDADPASDRFLDPLTWVVNR